MPLACKRSEASDIEIYLMGERKPVQKCPGCQDLIGATQSGSLWITNLVILWKSAIPAFSSPFAGICVLTSHKIVSQVRCLPSIEFWTSDSLYILILALWFLLNPSKLHYLLMVPTQPFEAAHQFGKLDLAHNSIPSVLLVIPSVLLVIRGSYTFYSYRLSQMFILTRLQLDKMLWGCGR